MILGVSTDMNEE